MIKNRNKTLKYFLYSIIAIVTIYSALWLLVTYRITNSLNSNFARQKINMGPTSYFGFTGASTAGYPFKIAFKIHDFVEDTEAASIKHDQDVLIGYDLLSQEIFAQYEGKSFARIHPVESGFGSELSGKYYLSIGSIPRTTLFKFLFSNMDVFYLLKSMQYINSSSEDVRVRDLVDNALITKDAKSSLKIDITHHKNYFSFQEFENDIPKKIYVKYKTSSEDTGPIFKKPVAFSLIYGTYLGSNKGYEFEGCIETKAKKLDIGEIYSSLKLDINKINFYDSYFTSEGNLAINNASLGDKKVDSNIKYEGILKIKKNFINDLDSNIRAGIKNIPHRSIAYAYVNQYLKYDVTKLNIDTESNPLKLSLDLSIKDGEKSNTYYDVEKLGLYYQDKFIEAKANFSNDYQHESIKGAIQVGNLVDIIEYLVNSYLDIQKHPDEELSSEFWTSFYLDYFDNIANSKNLAEEFHQFAFDIKLDVNNAKFGKYNLTQGRIIYYQKLFEHLKTYYQNKDEAIKYLRSNAPDYINDPKVFEIIVGAK